MTEKPFQVGERVHPKELIAWTYTGVSGRPGKDKMALRRFTHRGWVLEIEAHADPARAARVMSIRTSDQDSVHWQETRQRLMRNKRA